MAWILTSKASELCQTLGYHRIETYKNEQPDAAQYKQFLFWGVYIMDKSLCLRLGRSSTIHDFDVTVPSVPNAGLDTPRGGLESFFSSWAVAAKVQGQIYELLYCPDALAQPRDVRKSRAQLLLKQMEDLDNLMLKATVSMSQIHASRRSLTLTT